LPASRLKRPTARGKFLYLGSEKFWVRGVTYGPFRSEANGSEYRSEEVVERDFVRIAANGFDAIRTYTVPPRWLLDAAQRHHLFVMVGVPWEQHVAFLDDRKRARSIEERVRAGVRACAGHPAILCYAIGNEIPASIVRWHGRRPVERYVERLYQSAKAEDPTGLVTYVSYPTTEYLQLPFLDLVCFNVYLESADRLAAYLARLHNLANEKPLIMGEIGLDSLRHGEATQARVLDWQVRTAFASGCAGAFVFAWTDEWHRGGQEITDWNFGLTRRDRHEKAALPTIGAALGDVPLPKNRRWPRISVIVCSYNGARTIRDCFEGLVRLEYPDLEVIVVNDGSNDRTPAIAEEYGFRLISTKNRGLSSARNTGLQAATGEIVAYIDDDARPDPHWLTYLASTFVGTTHAGVGGPNFAPPGDGLIAECVANAPGGPVHVLLSDDEAEHIPWCNMAFRKEALEAIGGFDPQFWTAGDDVDVCWRILQRGWTLGFNPAAMVWHHRRNSVRAYWKQQRGYGKAEALLEAKWRDKYNGAGHVAWAGRIYGKGLPQALGWRRARIYQGSWGSAPFQAMYQPRPSGLSSLALMPEWYLVITALAALSAHGASWPPLLLALPLLVFALAAPIVQACVSAARAQFSGARSRATRRQMVALTALLYLIQPLARLRGRLAFGLTPWRRCRAQRLAWPWPRTVTIWSERWRASADRLQSVGGVLRAGGAVVLHGGDFDRWDLEVRGGTFGAIRILMALEEHGAGKQLVRLRCWAKCSPGWLTVTLLLAALATGAGLDGAWVACAMLGATALLLAVRASQDCAAAMAAVRDVMRTQHEGDTRAA